MSRVASGCESTGPRDPYGAFCRENHVALAGRPTGPLAGRTFAAKDVFDIEGVRTGWGHPDWLRDQPRAGRTATVIRLLLEAGASLVGKTVTDELCYSLSGENIHYGAPRNPRDPDRSPGGSSSGSVVAVTAGLSDFAIGTDCGGSVRLPASYCGVYGVRPTHGRVPTDGLHDLAPDFDCIGWFARDPELLLRVGRVLLRDGGRPRQIHGLVIADDAFGRMDADGRAAMAPALDMLRSAVGASMNMTLSTEGLDQWFEAFRVLQAAQVRSSLLPWVNRAHPRLGEGVRKRLEQAAAITDEQVGDARAVRARAVARMKEVLETGTVLCIPTVPSPAPLWTSTFDELEIRRRYAAMQLLCAAGLAGLPQVTLPLAEVQGQPVGISLVGPRESDIDLLHFAAQVCDEVPAVGGID